jgi:hypothetical protein
MAGSMSWTRRGYEIAAAVPVVTVFAALYAWAALTGDPTQQADAYLWLAVPFVIPTMLWLLTSRLLIQNWWEGTGARLSTMDAPGQLLAAMVATLPEPRQRWGEAMLSELGQVRGRSARWRFALSCARAALSLPLPAGWPVLAIVAGVVVAAVTAAYTVVGAALPGFGFFAAIFVAVVGAMVVTAIARARRVRLPVLAPTLLVTGAVAISVTTTAVFLVRHPAAAEGLSPVRAGVLAVAFAGSLWLAVAPPRRLGSGRLAPHLGVGAAAVFVLGILVVSRTTTEGLPAIWLIFGPMPTFMVPAFIAAAADRSFRAGMQAGIWTAVAVTPFGYALGMLQAFRQYATTGGWTFAGDAVPAGFTLTFAVLALVAILIIGFPFAVFGATAGAQLHRATSPAPAAVPPGTS